MSDVGLDPSLHLPPRARSEQRLWRIGEVPTSGFALAVTPGNYVSFSSLRSVVRQLQARLRGEKASRLTRLVAVLDELDGAGVPGRGVLASLMTDSVTYALTRRISRESVYTARVIDLGARVLNTCFADGELGAAVVVPDADCLDRLTLKLLARATLLLLPSDRFAWQWHSRQDPRKAAPAAGAGGAFDLCRRAFLLRLIELMLPRFDGEPRVDALRVGPVAWSQQEVSVALVLQNYDGCLLACEERSIGEPERGRLLGLALTNVGLLAEALNAWAEAERAATGPGQRAHLCYLQGLLEAKRHYDLCNSHDHYARGLAALSQSRGDGDTEDLALERAWLLNGIALNEAIMSRRVAGSEAAQHYTKSFALVREAFQLVREGRDPARGYLRFNILANSAFLLEMRGNHLAAADLLSKSFNDGLDEHSTARARLRSNVDYRIGVLCLRGGALDRAESHLRSAADLDGPLEIWSTAEKIRRALAATLMAAGRPDEAFAVNEVGLDLSREARAAEGAREHFAGMVAALYQAGNPRAARRAWEEAAAEGTLTHDQTDPALIRPSPPSPKLPAYIPEVDLEGTPAIDLNRFLGQALISNQRKVSLWS